MTSNLFSTLIKNTCIQITQSIIMHVVMNKFLPSIAKLFKYLNYLGFVKILVYFLCVVVLLFVIYKLYKSLIKVISSSSKSYESSKSREFSKKIFDKNYSNSISSFESKSSDFNLEPKKKIIHKISSSFNKNIKSNKSKKNNNLIKSELLLTSSLLSSSF